MSAIPLGECQQRCIGQLAGVQPFCERKLHILRARLSRSIWASSSCPAVRIRFFVPVGCVHRHASVAQRLSHIELHGPKIARHLTTEWSAGRVDQRFQGCLSR